ncbi:MAG: AgmX/PglI C-terminal domain-containing protein [Bdellovibrionaceae bacterium]|nr:AgmX/PglI C-terminal domain-containing protein [Pseudobdellovibrionaceae bacterium]
MQNLLIEQRGPNGLMKTWRLRPDQGSVSFGSSKFAELRSPIETLKGIQGVFEYRDDKWVYVNLDVRTQETDNVVELTLDKPTEIRVGTMSLQVIPLEVRRTLFQSLESAEFLKPAPDRKPFQLVTTYHGAKLLETLVLPLGKTFVSKFDATFTKMATSQTESWMRSKLGDLEISQRTIYLTSVEAMSMITKDQLIDDGGRKTMYATLAGSALLALLFLLSPNSKTVEEVAVAAAPPVEYREMKLTPPKKKKQSAPMQAQVQPPKAEQAKAESAQPAGAAQASGGGKAVSAIKALGSSRISQLIGKISASSAKSANIVVSNGVAAGSAPSGRALAAVGNVTTSGKDWSGDGKGQGVQIGTAGVAGGGSVKGMGGIAAGKTGSGGVGLLEEDGEVVGGLDREVIAAYIRSKLGEILYCYERQLSAQPDLYGKVGVKFTIAGTGQVETQRIGETTLKNGTVEGCILTRVAKWKFPTPEGGTKVMVTYPFLFKSTN